MTLIYCGMAADEPEVPPTEEECQETIKNLTNYANLWNSGRFEIPSIPPGNIIRKFKIQMIFLCLLCNMYTIRFVWFLENDIRYKDGQECFWGEDPPSVADAKDYKSSWESWMRESCHRENYKMPPFNIQKINKALKERGLGSRCKSGTCRWDPKRDDPVCTPSSKDKSDPSSRGSDSNNTKNGNNTAPGLLTASTSTTMLVIPTLMLVDFY